MHRSTVQTDLKKLDQQHEADPARQGTSEKLAPKTQGNPLPQASNEPRPLIATPPMARRGE
jgi:hypothetical protein